MASVQPSSNPFLLMMDPQAVLDTIEHSERLERLHRRICRPLDKPQLLASANSEQARHDRAIDESSFDDGLPLDLPGTPI